MTSWLTFFSQGGLQAGYGEADFFRDLFLAALPYLIRQVANRLQRLNQLVQWIDGDLANLRETMASRLLEQSQRFHGALAGEFRDLHAIVKRRVPFTRAASRTSSIAR